MKIVYPKIIYDFLRHFYRERSQPKKFRVFSFFFLHTAGEPEVHRFAYKLIRSVTFQSANDYLPSFVKFETSVRGFQNAIRKHSNRYEITTLSKREKRPNTRIFADFSNSGNSSRVYVVVYIYFFYFFLRSHKIMMQIMTARKVYIGSFRFYFSIIKKCARSQS